MYEFTPADPTIKRPGHKPPLDQKRAIIFIYIPLLAFASMMFDVVANGNDVIRVADVVSAIVLNVLALMWAKTDADEKGYELSQFFTLAVVLFGVFAILYYLFRSRGASDGLISTGWLVLYGVTLAVVLGLTAGIVTMILVAAGLLPQNVLDG
jgi:heme/copper-type cytochrome/quinol oxidase subunit 4